MSYIPIDQALRNIMSARYGQEVRTSIHDAIFQIDDIVNIKFGTDVTSPTSPSGDYSIDVLYINTDTYDIWKLVNATTWQKVGNIKGAQGSSVVSVTEKSHVGRVHTYTMTFSDGTTCDFTVSDGQTGSGSGDMLKSVYDTDDDGIVDKSELAEKLSDGTNTVTITDISNMNTAISGKLSNSEKDPTISGSLAEQISGKVDKNNIITSVDLNSIKEVGFYYCITCVNSPNSNGYMQVYASSNSDVTRFQVFTDIDSNIYKRTVLNNNWTSWDKLATSNELNSINSFFAEIPVTNEEIAYNPTIGVGIANIGFRKINNNSMNIRITGNLTKQDGTSLLTQWQYYTVANNVNLPIQKNDTTEYPCVLVDNDGTMAKIVVIYKTNGDLVIRKYTPTTTNWTNELISPCNVTFI